MSKIMAVIFTIALVLSGCKYQEGTDQLVKDVSDNGARPGTDSNIVMDPRMESGLDADSGKKLEEQTDEVKSWNDPNPILGNDEEPKQDALKSLFKLNACTIELRPTDPGTVQSMSFSLPDKQHEILRGINAISVRKLKDDAGYGFQFGSSFALNEEGRVFAWGQPYGLYTKGIAYPQLVEGLRDIKQISGLYALDHNGEVWFIDGEGMPELIEGLPSIVSISDTGDDILVAVTESGHLWLWAPKMMEYRGEKLVNVRQANKVKVAYGDLHEIYWIDQANNVWKAEVSWDLHVSDPIVVALPEGEKVVRVDTTFVDDYVITINGNIIPIQQEPRDTYVIPEQTVKITGTYGFQFYLKMDGTVWAVGSGHSLLGISEGSPLPKDPVQIKGLENIIDIQAGSDHVLALAEDGVIYSWGSNMYGQLGQNPHYFETFTSISEISGLQYVQPSYDEIRFVRNGDVYRVNSMMEIEPLLLGQQVVSFRDDEYLTTDGSLIIFSGDSCYSIRSEEGIKQIVRDNNGWIAKLDSGALFQFERLNAEIGAIRKVIFPEGIQPDVVNMYDYPFFTVLTKEGEVYYKKQETEDTIIMELIADLPVIREWSPTDYTYFDVFGRVVRVLDDHGNAYSLMLNVQWNHNNVYEMNLEVTKQLLAENVKNIYGGLLELEEGRIVETGLDRSYEADQPIQVDSRANLLTRQLDISSIYSRYFFPIEGPSSYRHILIGTDGTIMVNGDSPFFGYINKPAPVLLTK